MAHILEESIGLKNLLTLIPFHLDDTHSVNQTFIQWRKEQHPQQKKIVDLWVYAFAYRYFLSKTVQFERFSPTDADDLVAKTVPKIMQSISTLREEHLFAQWVMKSCKNAFISYGRSQEYKRMRYDDRLIEDRAESEEVAGCSNHDYSATYQQVSHSIHHLPDSLQEIAKMHFLQGLSYLEIEEKTKKTLPIIRSYVNKAKRLLREDPQIMALTEWFFVLLSSIASWFIEDKINFLN